jgi:hypothetical protein
MNASTTDDGTTVASTTEPITGSEQPKSEPTPNAAGVADNPSDQENLETPTTSSQATQPHHSDQHTSGATEDDDDPPPPPPVFQRRRSSHSSGGAPESLQNDAPEGEGPGRFAASPASRSARLGVLRTVGRTLPDVVSSVLRWSRGPEGQAVTGRPRKPPERRKDRYRKYPGEPGYRPPKRRNGPRAGQQPTGGTADPAHADGGTDKSDCNDGLRRAPKCAFPSLGPAVWEWAAAHLLVPDGPFAGEALLLTGDQTEVLYEWYRLDEFGLPVYRRGCWRAPQGAGKSPLLAVIALAELAGPSRCDGFDAKGQPVAVAPPSSHIQCAAVSSDQSANVYKAAYLMAAESDLAGDVLDVGLTRIHRKDGRGLLEPVTASAGSRLGQRLTFVVADESHLWNRQNGGDRLADVLRRNAAKMGGRSFEVSNAPMLGEGSVCEATTQAAADSAEGLLYVSREAPPVDDLTDFDSVRTALAYVYGDAATDRGGWVDLDRVAKDAGADPDTVRRYFFNQTTSGGLTPFDLERWQTLTRVRDIDPVKVRGLGFDGSQSRDGTAFYGATDDGHVFEIGNWYAPPGASKTWKVPRDEVMEVLRDALTLYESAVLYADPPLWQSELAQLMDEFSTRSERVVAVPTASAVRFAPMCERFATAIEEGHVTHTGDSTLTEALSACVKKLVRLRDDPEDMRTRFVVDKAKPRKNDAAIAVILAFSAAMEAPAPPPRLVDNIH